MSARVFFIPVLVLGLACQPAELITPGGSDGATPAPTPTDGGTTSDAATPPVPNPRTTLQAIERTIQSGAFQIPAGALGFQITGLPATTDVSLVSPDGASFVTNGLPIGSAFYVYELIQVPYTSASLGPIVAGTWTLEVSPPSQLGLTVQRTEDGQFHGGELDVYLYFATGVHVVNQDRLGYPWSWEGTDVPGPEYILDAAGAETNQDVQASVDGIFMLAKQLLNLDRGSVQYFDVAADLVNVTDSNEDRAFGVASMNAGQPGLHVLFVDNIRTSPGAFGVARAVPSRWLPGLGGNVIFVGPAVDDYQAIFHEYGHLVGLNHTTEFEGLGADELDDTPECPLALIQDANAECPDQTNIMFPSGALHSPQLSPGQVAIFRSSATYRPYATAALKHDFTARSSHDSLVKTPDPESTEHKPYACYRSALALYRVHGDRAAEVARGTHLERFFEGDGLQAIARWSRLLEH